MTGGRPHVAVIGGGVTGLTTAFELLAGRPALDVTVFEAASSAGGKIASHRAHGYTVDLGPNGFVDNGTDTRTLAEAVGLGDRLLPASDSARERFVLRGGRLVPLPHGPASFLTTPLLTPVAKARVLAEPLLGRASGEESVHGFLTRRFGRGAAAALAAPLVHGVTGGDPRAISLDAAFPRIRALERQQRSLLLTLLRNQWRVATGRAASTRPRLTSFSDGGMRVLVDGLVRALGEHLRTGQRVTGLERDPASGGGWLLGTAPGGPVRADQVVVAVPAPAAARLLRPHLPGAAAALDSVRHAPVRVLSLGYRRRDLATVPHGFGHLRLAAEPTRILGAVHSSAVFPDSAPRDGVLLRAFAGGAEDPDFTSLSTADAIRAAHHLFTTLFGPAGEPEFHHDHVWGEGIPQYGIGHQARMREVLDGAAELPGLHVAGSSYHGIAVNDCVRDARRAAAAVLAAAGMAPGPSVRTTSGDVA
ncbi:protoporphyrinogen oxidase [Streptomyces sp. CWNU-52B]|uniref:protoporphyrinogen oxidase n=1 Tax=unclassified Streptomyces TaxID=2593676 RepID=UPI0039C00A88